MREEALRELVRTRAEEPERLAATAAARRRRPRLTETGRLMLIAADHPARGNLAVGRRSMAMADRIDLLDRLRVALSRPGVDGVLGTPDVIEDLLLLDGLDGKVVIGSMNRGGIPGTAFEIDDRFTAWTPGALAAANLDGGKMLLRIDPTERSTVDTLESGAAAVSALAARRLMAMVEPFWVRRDAAGKAVNDLSPDAVIRSIAVAQALGCTSAYTWLKVPVVAEMERVMAASTLPALLLGGDPGEAPDEAYAAWQKALRLPTVRGLVVGRTLLYPPGDDVAAAVDTAVSLL
ncbi:aldolase [Asanoa sp. WMMD1127]|uniref:Cgl0159 family (beta/alpha)8-fold protein n=1 Tax=Asanoa sp. WMMD1127 TaxID=3016107 RepID=UPI0024171B13|nr:aldolase [Asanoa sp. WMMD1127]MDG4824864.1 aldolase [Asanoa sp. WMMD1127]